MFLTDNAKSRMLSAELISINEAGVVCKRQELVAKESKALEEALDKLCEHYTVHRGTCPTFAKSNARSYIPSRSVSFFRRLHVCVLSKKVICGHSDLHPSLA